MIFVKENLVVSVQVFVGLEGIGGSGLAFCCFCLYSSCQTGLYSISYSDKY